MNRLTGVSRKLPVNLTLPVRSMWIAVATISFSSSVISLRTRTRSRRVVLTRAFAPGRLCRLGWSVVDGLTGVANAMSVSELDSLLL